MESARLLKAIIENAIEGIITIDERGRIESINPAARRLFGYTAGEILNKNISVLMPEPDRSRHDQYISEYLKTGEKHIIGIGREVLALKKNGETFPIWLTVSEVHYKDRKIFTGFIHDLTRQKEAETKLLNYTGALEETVNKRTRDLIDLVAQLEETKENVSKSLQREKELSQLKSRFVSMASHEFRTPLSSIQLSATLINKYIEKKDLERVGKHTEKIRDTVELLTNILNDFLSLELLETGKTVAKPEVIDLESFSTEILEEMQLITKPKQKIRYQHTGPETKARLDPNLLKNAIVNLISNAIKYSGEDSRIEFNTLITDKQTIIEVKDNGIGIPEEDQAHLFEPFFRANNTGKIAGTGLGLNIVQRYVSLMNGKIDWSSQLNKGTTLRLIFTNT